MVECVSSLLPAPSYETKKQKPNKQTHAVDTLDMTKTPLLHRNEFSLP